MKRPQPGWVLAASLLGISFAGPLTRLSSAEPLAIAAWRLFFSLGNIAVALLLSGEWRDWRGLGFRDALLAGAAGVSLAFHFWAWNASVHLTTIAASVTLVSLQPAVIVAISAVFLREAPTRRQLIGICVAIAGAMIIAAPDWRATGTATARNAMLGNLLAASAAVTAAVYYSIGRHLRSRYGIWAYVGLAYSACALTLLVAAALTHTHLAPQPRSDLAIFAGLALGPMLLGHTGMNWALKYLPAYVVNLTVLGEPIGATLLGAMIPAIAQVPPLLTIVGGAIVLSGVTIAATGRAQRVRT
ncbi:MAG TPA: DMT family transporter [Gemmatimonadaceae bacterium]|nr:DMT family transporter [Gemmatimonadaceae bacterium]